MRAFFNEVMNFGDPIPTCRRSGLFRFLFRFVGFFRHLGLCADSKIPPSNSFEDLKAEAPLRMLSLSLNFGKLRPLRL